MTGEMGNAAEGGPRKPVLADANFYYLCKVDMILHFCDMSVYRYCSQCKDITTQEAELRYLPQLYLQALLYNRSSEVTAPHVSFCK